ncbi:hypothetical protein AWC38_SpisGene376 [Stylophora pistillata]|uniref:Uncharacterized protein n=1 Tax=Stylophora pistillata TaxID=50429 RepID=A0A2B4SY04_STYPI|nr:hypothetical protein AWC38_SpisGene376 [Stylophora pistillata]
MEVNELKGWSSRASALSPSAASGATKKKGKHFEQVKLPSKARPASPSSDGAHFTRKRHHTPATVPRTRLPPGTPLAERLAMESLKQKLSFEEKPETECLSPSKGRSGLVSQTSSGTQKLERPAEAGKLKFQGNKDQFLFNSELQGTLDDTANFLAARDVEKAGEKVEEQKKSLRHRQKIIKLADKSEAGWLAVKEYQTEELASDSEDEKRIKKDAFLPYSANGRVQDNSSALKHSDFVKSAILELFTPGRVSPYIFIKLLGRPIVKHWRSQGIHTVVYLEEGFDVESTKLSSEIYSRIIRSDLALAGFLANEDKSVWDPVRLITWLGIVWDGLLGKISIAEPRIDDALLDIDNTLQDPRLSARGLASIVGKIISMSPVLGNLSRIKTGNARCP